MRRGPAAGPRDADGGAARPDAPDARTGAGLQRVPVGGTNAHRRRRHAPAGPAGGMVGGARMEGPRHRGRTGPLMDGAEAVGSSPATEPPPVGGPGWAYFFDLDGTLVDIVDPPAVVRVDAGLRELLEALRQATGGAVAL